MKIPNDRRIDGLDLSGVIKGIETKSPRDTFFYWFNDQLFAVRYGKWKLHKQFASPIIYWNPTQPLKEPVLYDLETDPSEKYDLFTSEPEVVKYLDKLYADHLQDAKKDAMKDNLSEILK